MDHRTDSQVETFTELESSRCFIPRPPRSSKTVWATIMSPCANSDSPAAAYDKRSCRTTMTVPGSPPAAPPPPGAFLRSPQRREQSREPNAALPYSRVAAAASLSDPQAPHASGPEVRYCTTISDEEIRQQSYGWEFGCLRTIEFGFGVRV